MNLGLKLKKAFSLKRLLIALLLKEQLESFIQPAFNFNTKDYLFKSDIMVHVTFIYILSECLITF